MATATTSTASSSSRSLAEELRLLIEQNLLESNDAAIQLLTPLTSHDYSSITYPHGENLLHWCAAFNNITIASYLLQSPLTSYYINLMNSRNVTPLCYAALRNHYEIIELLLRYGADIRIRNGFSNLIPQDITNNPQIQELIKQYEYKIPLNYDENYVVKENRTLVHCWEYRNYLFWNILLTASFLKKNNIYNTSIRSIEETPIMKDVYENQDFEEILRAYEGARDRYEKGLENTDIHFCLSCQQTNSQQNLQRCSRCKKVYFCDNKCQRKCHDFHKFDCKP